MAKALHKNILKLIQLLVFSGGIWFVNSGNTQVNKSIDEYRFQVALKLFPRIAATDQQLNEKLSNNGKIWLLIYYTNKPKQARQLIEILADDIPRIGKRDIEYRYSNKLDEYSGSHQLPTAIFLAEPLNTADLRKLTEYSQKYHRLVFSPFEGDVERGITAGIYISNKITPYFNKRALIMADINLHKGLLRVSTQYE
ncbi:MAG: hypothetical protein P8Y28_10220 [Gammaproteobacteria bacterium]|jgi:hypothetical protein